MIATLAAFTILCSALAIAFSLMTCAFAKATTDYLHGRRDTRAVAFHQWTERVVERCKR